MEISQESPPFMAMATTTTTTEVSASLEFEFWMLGKSPQPSSLLTADELFVDGVLLPLHLLSISHSNTSADSPTDELNRDPPPPPTTTSSAASPAPAPAPAPAPTPTPPPPAHRPKKWRDHIPRAGAREKAAAEDGGKEQRRPKERRGSAGGPAELNINLWPFSRSRSAGNAAAAAGSWSARARAAVAGRKVSSAPCSRSNSRGESSAKPATTPTAASPSSSRRWAPSASRVAAFAGGIHLGRTTPVWKIHKKVSTQPAGDPNDKASAEAAGAKKAAAGSTPAAGVRVLNFHVNTCIGYRNRESCSSSNHPSRIVAGGGGVGGGESGGSGGGGGGSIFKLRTIFSKNNNVY